MSIIVDVDVDSYNPPEILPSRTIAAPFLHGVVPPFTTTIQQSAV